VTNDEQACYCTGDEAAHWLACEGRYERMLAPFTGHVMTAAAIGRADRVVDIGGLANVRFERLHQLRLPRDRPPASARPHTVNRRSKSGCPRYVIKPPYQSSKGSTVTKFRGNPWAVLLAVSLGFFMTLLDLTIVNIAIPDMIARLHASLDDVL